MHDLLSRFNNYTLGFNDLFNNLETLSTQTRSFPPYNIDSYIDENQQEHTTITLAVAGFGEKDISVNIKENILTVTGSIEVSENQTQKKSFYRGISGRKFEQKFILGQYIEVDTVTLKDGLLTIDTKKVVPEHAKAKMIPINGNLKALESPKTTKSVAKKA